jgi:TPR repeat protein
MLAVMVWPFDALAEPPIDIKKALQLEAKGTPDPRLTTADALQLGGLAMIEEDYATALKVWKRLAEQGNATAQLMYGNMYREGQGVPQNYAVAIKWFQLAADQGDADAQIKLGVMYYKGRGVPQNYAVAIKWFQLAADQGDADAQTNLGVMYGNGRGVPQDYKTALKWYTLSAKQGNATAQTNLGVMHENGQGVPQNYAVAIKWFQLAADQGDATAQFGLGVMYEKGKGVPQNSPVAIKWFQLAADQGDATAQFNLGVMYANGQGVPQDDVEAIKWLRLAAEQGSADAKAGLKTLESKLARQSRKKPSPPPRSQTAANTIPTKPIKARFRPSKPRPDDIAVIIGNANYKKLGRDIPNVTPAYADAEGIKRYVRQALGIAEDNIIYIKDATQKDMISTFGSGTNHKGKLFRYLVPGKSRVFVYYAGHGAPGEGDSNYLVPTDAEASLIDLNGYPIKTLYKNLSKLPAKSVTVVLEACFSGASQGGSLIQRSSGITVVPKASSVPSNITVISAGAADQIASWEEDKSHSLFTKYFLKGMSGEADANKDSKVSWAELKDYLAKTVTRFALRYYGREQTAQIVSGG